MKILILSKRHYTGKDLVGDRYGRVFEFSRRLASLGHKVHGLAFDYHRRDTGLFDEILDDRLLLAVKPARAITRRWKGCSSLVIARTDYP